MTAPNFSRVAVTRSRTSSTVRSSPACRRSSCAYAPEVTTVSITWLAVASTMTLLLPALSAMSISTTSPLVRHTVGINDDAAEKSTSPTRDPAATRYRKRRDTRTSQRASSTGSHPSSCAGSTSPAGREPPSTRLTASDGTGVPGPSSGAPDPTKPRHRVPHEGTWSAADRPIRLQESLLLMSGRNIELEKTGSIITTMVVEISLV